MTRFEVRSRRSIERWHQSAGLAMGLTRRFVSCGSAVTVVADSSEQEHPAAQGKAHCRSYNIAEEVLSFEFEDRVELPDPLASWWYRCRANGRTAPRDMREDHYQLLIKLRYTRRITMHDIIRLLSMTQATLSRSLNQSCTRAVVSPRHCFALPGLEHVTVWPLSRR